MKQCCLCGKSGHESSYCKWIPPNKPISIADASFRDELEFNSKLGAMLKKAKGDRCKSNQS